ncbi:MAG: 16S rRNA processing protein RimM [Solirubrobacteraceae bacterium]|nr:16S rRNA processing protein RimM [Solirubrobacteraceae bacterium]
MTTSPGQAPERVPAGTIGKAHGLDGSFYVVKAAAALLAKGAQVFVDGEAEPRTVERRSGTDDRPILRLSGAASRNDADALRGKPLTVALEHAPELDDDEYWAHDLVGCSVQPKSGGDALGLVVELMAYPSCEILKVDGGPRGELLVPLVRDAILEVDVPGRRITVDDEFLALDE